MYTVCVGRVRLGFPERQWQWPASNPGGQSQGKRWDPTLLRMLTPGCKAAGSVISSASVVASSVPLPTPTHSSIGITFSFLLLLLPWLTESRVPGHRSPSTHFQSQFTVPDNHGWNLRTAVGGLDFKFQLRAYVAHPWEASFPTC